MQDRFHALKNWLGQTLKRDFELRPASEDASFRRYFRVTTTEGAHIVMDAPPDKEDARAYVEVAERFYRLGLNVPRILEWDKERGFLLITDLGARMYLDCLNPATVEPLYNDALNALVTLQTGILSDSGFLPDYDLALLKREMELFREWYLGQHLGIALGAAHHRVLDEAFTVLAQSALEQPKVWVHRDYHSRNLMVTPVNNPGILDFQDAVRGPITYDLVSLLRDCYIAWPQSQVEAWVKAFHARAGQAGLPVGPDGALFLRWFDYMGVQRHLKAIGIFARLNHRDGKPGYLKDIPRTLGYVVDVCRRHRPLTPLARLLNELGVDKI